MKSSPRNLATGLALILIGAAFAAGGIYVGETDDAPGAALLGFLFAGGLSYAGVKIMRRRR